MIKPPSTLELALLGLLHERPQSGYDLRKAFTSTPLAHFSDSPGSIYPALHRMEARGWLQGKTSGEGRARKVFRPSVKGRAVFSAWLRRTITREDVTWSMDDLILRFAFMDGQGERTLALRFLAELEAQLAIHIHDLQAYQDSGGATLAGSTGALALENGIAQYRAHLTWSQEALARLSIKESAQ